MTTVINPDCAKCRTSTDRWRYVQGSEIGQVIVNATITTNNEIKVQSFYRTEEALRYTRVHACLQIELRRSTTGIYLILRSCGFLSLDDPRRLYGRPAHSDML